VIVHGAQELADKVGRISGRLERPTAAEEQVGQVLSAHMARRFASDGDGQWAPLLEETVSRKSAEGLDPRILRATGALEEALTGGKVSTGGTTLTYRPDAPDYAVYADAKRPIVGVDDELAGQVSEALADHVMEP
jgi:hypothetical protein